MHKITPMACALAGLLLVAAPAYAQTARSLSDIPGMLKTPEAKAVWDREMAGKPQPDGFGTRLPDGLVAEALTGMLVPATDHGHVTLVGANAWPRVSNSYVAIVCTRTGSPRAGAAQDCEGGDSGTLKVYLGVIERVDGAMRLVAASGPVRHKMDWNSTMLSDSPMASESKADGRINPERWERFDLAPYRISNSNQYAFGLRAGWSESYAGGGASFGALYLFAVDGDQLRVVFAEPMSFYKDIAGEWNPDHTREHEISEGEAVLAVSPRMTNGHYDLLLKSSTDDSRQVFKWEIGEHRYRAAAGSGK